VRGTVSGSGYAAQMPLNWDDLRFVLALSRAGSLARAAKALNVDHTTVGRRVEALEESLGIALFARTSTGYVLSAEAESLLPSFEKVEESVLALERAAHTKDEALEGTVRVTSGETLGAVYLAPRLAKLGREHPGLTLEVFTGGQVLDLARREADIAVRLFRSKHESLVIRKVGDLAHGLYASKAYLAERPWKGPKTLAHHAIVNSMVEPGAVEAKWVEKLTGGKRPVFVSNLTTALLEAAKAGAGVTVLPRYVGDAEPSLTYLPMADEPREPIWITVHRDLKQARRIRVVLDYLRQCISADSALFLGK
jgi:DNA-binding transcriptional LysR family regulator